MCRLSWNLGASTSWNPLGLSRTVMGLLYLFPFQYYPSPSCTREESVVVTLLVCCLEASAFIYGLGAKCRVKIFTVFISYPRECQESTLVSVWKCVSWRVAMSSFPQSYTVFRFIESLLPRNGASSCWEWKRQHSDMEGGYECIEYAVTNIRQRAILQLGKGVNNFSPQNVYMFWRVLETLDLDASFGTT